MNGIELSVINGIPTVTKRAIMNSCPYNKGIDTEVKGYTCYHGDCVKCNWNPNKEKSK